jgi:hypothetical protein
MTADGLINPNDHHLTATQKILLGVASVACLGIWYLLHTLVGIPVYPHFSAGILSDKPVIGGALALIGIPVISVLASLIVGRVRFEAGLFCCLIGLITLPAHGGDIRDALLTHGPGVYVSLAIESLLLGIGIIATCLILDRMRTSPLLAPPAVSSDADPDTTSDRITAVIVQALVTLALLTLICQSPQKGQTLATAALASMLAAMLVHQIYVVRGSVWYIAGTMLASVIAYLYTGLFSPAGAEIGVTTGMTAGAARPLPLHYATLGCAGAIFGYWCSLIWHAAKKAKELETVKTA